MFSCLFFFILCLTFLSHQLSFSSHTICHFPLTPGVTFLTPCVTFLSHQVSLSSHTSCHFLLTPAVTFLTLTFLTCPLLSYDFFFPRMYGNGGYTRWEGKIVFNTNSKKMLLLNVFLCSEAVAPPYILVCVYKCFVCVLFRMKISLCLCVHVYIIFVWVCV